MAAGLGIMAVLAVVAVGSVRAAWGMYQKFSDASVADTASQGELASLQSQYQSVSTTVDELNTQEGMDAAIRERYGVGMPGEGEIDIVQQSTTSAAQATSSQSWLGRVWSALFAWL